MFVTKGLRKIGQTWKGTLRDTVNIIKEIGANSQSPNSHTSRSRSNWRSDRDQHVT
jgi:hypothetical protein